MTWEQVPLGRIIGRFEAGVSVRSQDRPASNGEHGVLKVSCVSPLGFRSFENKVVLPEEVSRLGPSPRRGDVLLTRANTVELVAMAVTVDRDYPTLHLSDKHWRIVLRNPQEDSLAWVKHVVNSTIVRHALVSRATGTSGSMKNVSQEEFLKIRVVRPPGGAQQRIAAVLDEFDDAHRELEALLHAKRRLKRGLAQQLLMGKRRFKEFVRSPRFQETVAGPLPEDWGVKSLRDLFTPVTRRNTSGIGFVLTASGEHGLVNQGDYFSRSVAGDDLKGYYLLRKGEFAYNRSLMKGYPCGAIKRLEQYDEGTLSTLYICFALTAPGHDPDFFAQVFEGGLLNRQLSQIIKVGARAHGLLNVTAEDFYNVRVPVPSEPEQRAIAQLLSACDRELDLLERLRNGLDQQRRSVAELLLTGKVRVPA